MHGESKVNQPHWDFWIGNQKFHATPHYSGCRLLVSFEIDSHKYLATKGWLDADVMWSSIYDAKGCWIAKGEERAITPEVRWILDRLYDQDNTLWQMLGSDNIEDPLDAEPVDNTPYHKGDDQPE